MENGAQNGIAPTNHDRDFSRINGVNGASPPRRDSSPERQKTGAEKDQSKQVAMNGDNSGAKVNAHRQDGPYGGDGAEGSRTRMNDLPNEIQHITDNFIPLSFLLSRLAQRSHNALQEKIVELAQKPLPAATMNGTTETFSLDNDESAANLEKKRSFLNFVQNEHSNWVKALVIIEWSKKAEQVSKLIDLKGYLMGQMQTHDNAMANMMDLKRNLTFARLPSPDLKTALQILSDGEVPWLSDLDFIAPPPIDPKEQLKWMDNINTLLSLRLNLEDHDSIPYYFRDYAIASGRVTFKVKGEFEVDLTIADEDFEKQLWFIDFRFCFSPAPSEPSEALRSFLEGKVNDVLGSEGLPGCYKFLHEYVLTHKINELKRQALELRQGRWIDTLKVEPLNRALAIQYWASKPRDNLKSWIIIGVHSGKTPGCNADERTTSRLNIRWFRDNVEVKNADIPFDTVEISTESLLKAVIARHTEHILSTIHDKLSAKPRFAKRQAALRLHISRTEPMDSFLEVQMTYQDRAVAKIDPVTGSFAMGPHSRIVAQGEHRLNLSGKDPTEDGVNALDGIRCLFATEELNRRAKSFGWIATRSPVKTDALRSIVNTRENYQAVWYRRQDWDPRWHIMVSLSLSGDRWWLMELVNNQSGPAIGFYVPLPQNPAQPNLQDPFFSNFNIFVSGIISQISDMRDLKAKRIKFFQSAVDNPYLTTKSRFPAIHVSLTELLSYRTNSSDPLGRHPWALNSVRILVKGVGVDASGARGGNPSTMRNTGVTEARLMVTDRKKFSLLQGKVDHDVAFNHRTGEFCLTIRSEVGKSAIDMLIVRLQAIVRLVDFLDNIQQGSQGIVCDTVTLRQVVFTYGALSKGDDAGASAAKRWRVVLDLAAENGIRIELEKNNPHLRIYDLLVQVVNDPVTFGYLPSMLSTTLPLLTTLDKMEEAWKPIDTNGEGSLTVFPRSMNWLGIRYRLPSPQNAQKRQLDLSLRLRSRGSANWWCVARRNSLTPSGAEDEFDRALQNVWDGSGTSWIGLNSAAAASPEGGVGPLLEAVDQAVRALVGTSPPPAPAPAAIQPQQVQGGQAPKKQQSRPNKAAHARPTEIKPDVVDLT